MISLCLFAAQLQEGIDETSRRVESAIDDAPENVRGTVQQVAFRLRSSSITFIYPLKYLAVAWLFYKQCLTKA